MNDIARTVHQEKMRVQANGRRTFQQVHLWMPDNKNTAGKSKYERGSTTQQYQPNVDGPSQTPCPILPRGNELVDHEDAKLYLEVGIIIGADPTRYESKGLKSKQRNLDRQRRGILPRDDGAMRVFIPVTEYIAPQAKFYVGCRLSGGRLLPRVIETDSIFFYSEFWRGISDSLNLKPRRAEMATACKRAAAINKSGPANKTVPGASANASDVGEATLEPVRQVQEPIPTAVRSEGSDAFFDFDRPLSAENARKLALDLMVNYSSTFVLYLMLTTPSESQLQYWLFAVQAHPEHASSPLYWQ